jgi:hypothetical protein
MPKPEKQAISYRLGKLSPVRDLRPGSPDLMSLNSQLEELYTVLQQALRDIAELQKPA